MLDRAIKSSGTTELTKPKRWLVRRLRRSEEELELQVLLITQFVDGDGGDMDFNYGWIELTESCS